MWWLAAAVVLAVAELHVHALAAEGPAPKAALKAEADEAPPKRHGALVRVNLPVDGQTFTQVRRSIRRAVEKARSEGARPVIVLEFNVPGEKPEAGAGSQFGAAYQLADFLSGDELNAATTVAYLPTSIQGHAVLVAMACDEIVMAPGAEMGKAGADERTINPALRSAYSMIASRRKTVPAEIALGMLDPAHEVLEVETELSREFVTPSGLEELKKKRTIQSQRVLIPAGQPGQFTGREARRLGFASYLADNRREAIRALELPPESVEEELTLVDEDWRPVRVDLRGPVTAESVNNLMRMIDDAVRQRDANFLCVWIESPGGSPADSMDLANHLAGLRPDKIRTVAYIPKEARADAAMVAMACNQVVMHPRAILGGSGAQELSEEQVRQLRETIKDLGKRSMRSWSLWAAMIDPGLEVSRFTARRGDEGFFSSEELEEQPDRANWQKSRRETTPGRPFSAKGYQAVEYHLAHRTVENFGEFKQYYDLKDPTLLEPGWADRVVDFLKSPGIAALLLMIGGIALYIELHTPGLGLGGFIATVCFALFFWSNYLGGTAGWLEITLFLAGICCLALEIFVIPGFGIFGLGGGALVLVSLVLATQTSFLPRNEYQLAELQTSLLSLAGAITGIVVGSILLRRWLPHTPGLNRMFLPPPSDEEAQRISRREALADYHDLVGVRGTATTQLTPGGKARFGNRLVDVMAEGELIERGAAIEVVEVHGNRVVVREVRGSEGGTGKNV